MKRFTVVTFGVILLSLILSGCEGPEANECVGNSCNITKNNITIINEDPPAGCADGDTVYVIYFDADGDQTPEAYVDTNGDGIADAGITDRVCMDEIWSLPWNWTLNPGPPWDDCYNPNGEECGTVPTVTIAAGVDDNDVNITSAPIYNSGTFTKVDYFAGSVKIGTVTNSAYNWNYRWLNPTPGTYDLWAIGTTNDGKTATSNHVTVTINAPTPQFAAKLRTTWAYTTPSDVDYYNYVTSSCYTTWAGQDPRWQNSTARSCHDASNGCEIEDNMYAGTFNEGGCMLNNVAPEFLNGNPANPFGQDYLINTAYTPEGTDDCYNALADGFFRVFIDPNSTADWVEVPVVPRRLGHGCNAYVDYTGAVATNGVKVNLFTLTHIDGDGDGYYNACESGTSCQLDNCIRYPNPDQTDSNHDGVGDACVNDLDNDWYPNEEDLYPYDRTRF